MTTPQQSSISAPADLPDVLARLIDKVDALMPEVTGEEKAQKLQRIEAGLRKEFGGGWVYIQGMATRERERTKQEVLSRFNGRNATSLARELGITRATVYRYLKQAG